MDLLQRLRPRWRHPDAEIRAAAVRELGAEDQEHLETIAREDPDPHVRRIAIKKVQSADVLQAIATDDVDTGLRDLAAERAREVWIDIACAVGSESDAALARLTDERSFAAVVLRGAREDVRSAALARVQSDRTLRDIVRDASDMVVRRAALDRLSDPAALRSIAVSDCPSELALGALARIGDAEVLRAISEHHGAAKDVRHRARELLAEKAGEGAPIAFKDARAREHALCMAAEGLSTERNIEVAATRLRELQREWEELTRQVPPREDTAARFAKACDAILEAAASIMRRRAEVEHKQLAVETNLATRRALCEQVEGLAGGAALRGLSDARAEWARLPPLSDDSGLSRRFAEAGEACEERLRQWLADEGQRAEIVALVEEAEALAAETPVPSGKRWRALEARWTPAATAGEDDLRRRFAAAKERFEERRREGEQEQAQLRQKNLARLESLCARVQDLAKAESSGLRTVRRELRALDAALQDPGPLPPSERRDAWTERLSSAREDLMRRLGQEEETEEWRRWANAGAQEEIIRRVESLLESNDLLEGTRQLGRLQEEWAQVASATPDKSQALWERFRTARNELRKRCDAYLAENLEKKRALVAQVADVGDSASWNETADLIRRLQAEWKAIGPAPAKHAQALWKQFREPCDRFFARRNEHWEQKDTERKENARQRTALCEQAEALADSTDWESTTAAMKKLQAEWKRVGPLPRAEAERLWQRFRGACDRFFERRGRREEIEREATLEKAAALCDELESIGASLEGADAPSDEAVGKKVDESWAEWRRLELGTGEDVRALGDRLVQVVRRIAASRPESLTGTRLDPAATRKRREKLCLRLEELAASANAEPKKLSLQEMALALREKLATNTIAGGAGKSGGGRQKVGEEVAKIVTSWAQLGPALDEEGRGFEERFEKARAKAKANAA